MGKFSVEDLVDLFHDSEDSSYDARGRAEKARDYVDNKQLTSAEIKALKKRGQPEVIINRIKRKVDFLRGYELAQRVDPRVLPRTPVHETDAIAAQQAIKYVKDFNRYNRLRSKVYDNLLVEGAGGYSVTVKKNKKKDVLDVIVKRAAWDRMFWDPHSMEEDFSDAKFLGLVKWMDLSDARMQYPDSGDILENTMNDAANSETYDDSPKHKIWGDRTRQRIRICQIWIHEDGEWWWAEFTKAGILDGGQSPYVDENGDTEPELVFGSAYVDRDGNRYGLVQEMLSPQDEINKRRSKALHLLNSTSTIYEEGAIDDVNAFRRERAKPDGMMKVNTGFIESVKTETRIDLAQAQLALLQESKNEIDMMGGNIAMEGDALQKSRASGKAIIASQQGGAMEIAPLIDNLRDLDVRLFRTVWNRIRQFWTEERWIRVTDDEANVKWVGLNVDQMRQQEVQNNPQYAERVKGMMGSIAELDCDITIEVGPDGITPELEQWQGLVELRKAGAPIPIEALIEAAPNLRNRERLREALRKQAENQGPDPEVAKVQAQAQAKQMELQMNYQMKQQELQMESQLQREKMEQDLRLKQQEMMIDAEMQRQKTQTEAEINVHKIRTESAAKNEADAENPVIKSNTDLQGAMQALAEGTSAIQEAIVKIAEAAHADTVLVRDPATGRAVGARKIPRASQESAAM